MDQRSGLYSLTSGLRVSAEMVWIFFFPPLFPFPLRGFGNPGRKEEALLTKLRCDVDSC